MPRELLSLDAGWRFHLGDIPFPKLIDHHECYNNAKAGLAAGAAAPGFDDTGWREVDLPHDWASESPFVPTESLAQGYRPRGIGWYRRHFRLGAADQGRHLELRFDGAASHCTVWVNGTLAHRNFCGYTGWSVDLTPLARFGEEPNCIAIRVDADQMEGWWYEGAGLYRHTWLVKRDPVHIVTDGVYADPERIEGTRWSIPTEITLASCALADETVEVSATLLDPAGREVVSARGTVTVPSFHEAKIQLPLAVDSPALWHVDSPVLHTVRCIVRRKGSAADQTDTTCGFRTLRFSPDEGFFLNDEPLKLQGVCGHQDHAGVGVAIPDSLWEWRLRQLKHYGVNAYRVGAHPQSAELLDCCDRLGILVMNENRHFNCSPEYVRQLEWLVRRDRNHPSVFLWCIFNEEPIQGTPSGLEMVRRLVAAVRRLDGRRPVTAAMNGGLFNPTSVTQAVDVVGFNYQAEGYDRFHALNPTKCVLSSEDTSAFMTRGEFFNDDARHIRASYDDDAAPWGATHRHGWRAIAERPFMAGGFAWTGFDYHGEPTPFTWPTASSFFGMLDLCGFPKTAAHMHRAHYTPLARGLVLELAPHWNWPGREGRPMKVLVITNAPRATLSLNGTMLGTRTVDRFDFATWEVPYQPGRLEAVAGDEAGRELGRVAVETTGEPVALELVAERGALAGDGCDTQPVTVRALDAQGRAVPTANLPVQFAIDGPAAIIGLGNGDPNSHEPEKGLARRLFNGLAQLLVQGARRPGVVVLRAESAGLKPAELRLQVLATAPRAEVPAVAPALFLRNWRMSPVSATPLDPSVPIPDHDMNTWINAQPGETHDFPHGSHALYRNWFVAFAAHEKGGATLRFDEITGRAEVWVDDVRVGVKTGAKPAPLAAAVPPGRGKRQVTVLVSTEPNRPAGLSGPTWVS